MDVVALVFLILVVLGAAVWFVSARVVRQIERGVVFRLGRAQERVRQPGLTMLVPFVDRMTKVNVQVITLPVPAQDGITRDNVTVKVDAVVYFRVTDPMRAAVVVEDYRFAILQVAQTSLRTGSAPWRDSAVRTYSEVKNLMSWAAASLFLLVAGME